ncbi:MAG: glycosyltransferase [Candidatus Dormibacteraceae bacterium]
MSCRPLYGHYAPMVALARAIVEAGHQVRFATAEPLLATIRADGFEAERAGLSAPEIAERRTADPELAAAVSTGMAMAFFSRSFAGFEVPPRFDDMMRIVHDWSPDLLVHEMSEFAGPLVAAVEGMPAVNHSYGPLVEARVMESAGAAAAEHWIAHGLSAPDRGGMYGRLYLDIAPPSLQFPYISTVPSVQPLRPVPLPGMNTRAAATWLSLLGPQPVITVTFGTVFNNRLELYRVVIEALGNTDLQVVIASGRSEAAKSLGPLPSNIQLHEWVPWAELVARSSVVVTHGGAGSTLGPLSAGIPLVMIPLAADHFKNAGLVSATGAAVALDAGALNPSQLRDAVTTALGESARTAAQRIADEIGRMPSPEEVVPVLATLR